MIDRLLEHIHRRERRNQDTSLFVLCVYFMKILTYYEQLYTSWVFRAAGFCQVRRGGELCSRYVKVDWWTGVASLAPPPHFLDSLACLFLGGAHFKHIVSTVRETRHAVSDRKQNTERCRRTPSCCLVARRRVSWGVARRHKAKKKQQHNVDFYFCTTTLRCVHVMLFKPYLDQPMEKFRAALNTIFGLWSFGIQQ